MPLTNFIHLLFITPLPQAEQKSYYEHPKKIVRSLRPNYAVDSAQSCGRCGSIVRSFFLH